MGEKNSKEVTITYETLFELLRIEKNKEGLQELQESFYDDLKQYLKDKITILNSQKDNIFSADEREKTERQLQSIKKIFTDLYERRERKIINLAINKVKTNGLINTTSLLEPERQLFDKISLILSQNRAESLANILGIINGKRPQMPFNGENRGDIVAKIDQKQSEDASDVKDAVSKMVDGMIKRPNVTDMSHLWASDEGQNKDPGSDKTPIGEEGKNQENQAEKAKELKREANNPQNTQVIRFLQAIPKFVGPNLEIYGPFDEEDIANLPEKVANVLVQKGRAEILNQG